MLLQNEPVLEAPGLCCRAARMALDEVQLELSSFGFSVDAPATGRSWEKRELADKGRPRQAWNTALCNKGYRKQGLVKGGVSLVWLNNLPGK